MLNSEIFRHIYCAARPQTLDRGAPVSLYTVSRELGHGSEEMVRRVYSHLGTVRHRSDAVEYRIEQHREALEDSDRRSRGAGHMRSIVAVVVTVEPGGQRSKSPTTTEVHAGGGTS
jgi:hypothetical protein